MDAATITELDLPFPGTACSDVIPVLREHLSICPAPHPHGHPLPLPGLEQQEAILDSSCVGSSAWRLAKRGFHPELLTLALLAHHTSPLSLVLPGPTFPALSRSLL